MAERFNGIERVLNNIFDTIQKALAPAEFAARKFAATIQKVQQPLTTLGKIKVGTAKALTKTFEGFKKAGKAVKSLGSGLFGIISQFVDFGSILKVLEPIFAPINALLDIFAGTISQTIQPVIQELFEVFMDPQIIEIMTLLAQIFGQVLVAAIRIVIAVVKKLQEIGVFDFLIAILTAVVEGVTWFADNLDIVWNAIVIGFTAVVDFFIAIGDFFIAVWEGIVSAFETVVNFFIDIWEGVLAFFSGVVKFFDMIWKAIVSGFFAFVNFFIGIINGVIDLLNALDFADVFEDIPRISTLSLPTAQTGGFVKQGGAVIVHPNERILTAEETTAVTNNNNARSITVNIEAIVLDDESTEKLAREVERTMIRVNS
ncbi:MAG: hypothetical protein ACYTKD_24830 [Planctomycetota bacterium]|jgi:hypothetical protein